MLLRPVLSPKTNSRIPHSGLYLSKHHIWHSCCTVRFAHSWAMRDTLNIDGMGGQCWYSWAAGLWTGIIILWYMAVFIWHWVSTCHTTHNSTNQPASTLSARGKHCWHCVPAFLHSFSGKSLKSSLSIPKCCNLAKQFSFCSWAANFMCTIRCHLTPGPFASVCSSSETSPLSIYPVIIAIIIIYLFSVSFAEISEFMKKKVHHKQTIF